MLCVSTATLPVFLLWLMIAVDIYSMQPDICLESWPLSEIKMCQNFKENGFQRMWSRLNFGLGISFSWCVEFHEMLVNMSYNEFAIFSLNYSLLISKKQFSCFKNGNDFRQKLVTINLILAETKNYFDSIGIYQRMARQMSGCMGMENNRTIFHWQIPKRKVWSWTRCQDRFTEFTFLKGVRPRMKPSIRPIIL